MWRFTDSLDKSSFRKPEEKGFKETCLGEEKLENSYFEELAGWQSVVWRGVLVVLRVTDLFLFRSIFVTVIFPPQLFIFDKYQITEKIDTVYSSLV